MNDPVLIVFFVVTAIAVGVACWSWVAKLVLKTELMSVESEVELLKGKNQLLFDQWTEEKALRQLWVEDAKKDMDLLSVQFDKWSREHPIEEGWYIACQEFREAKGISPLKLEYTYFIVYLSGQPPIMDATVFKVGARGHNTVSKAGEFTGNMDYWTPFVTYSPLKETDDAGD